MMASGKPNKFFFFLLCTILSFQAFSQQAQYSKAEIDRMVLTYNFYVVQDISLRVLSAKFPSLEKYARHAAQEWEHEFLSSVTNIDTLLSHYITDQWNTDKKQMIYKYEGADYSTISEKTARQFIDIVFQRSLGKMESPIVETLLIFKPEYANTPENELNDGFVNIYTTKNPKKPNELNIKIVYPKSWKASAGSSKSNCMQKFSSQWGFGNLELQLYIEKNKKNYTPALVGELLTKNNLCKAIPTHDSIQDFNTNSYIDNNTTSTITYVKEIKGNDQLSFQVCKEYHTFYTNNHIKLLFTFNSGCNDRAQAYIAFNKYNRLIWKIVNNVVILTQWEKKRF